MYWPRKENINQQLSEPPIILLLVPFVLLKILLLLEPQITSFLSSINSLLMLGF